MMSVLEKAIKENLTIQPEGKPDHDKMAQQVQIFSTSSIAMIQWTLVQADNNNKTIMQLTDA